MNLKKILLGTCLVVSCVGMIGCSTKVKEDANSYASKVTLGKYKGIKVEKVSTEPTEEAIQQEIDTYLQNVKSDDKIVDNGESVNIDYVGTIDGKEFSGGSYEGYNLKIGSKTFIEGFEEQLVGKKVGKTYKINVTFPKEYTEDLAGKKAVFKVKINFIGAKELTDDIVKKDENNEFKTVKEFKDNIISELEDELEDTAESTVNSSIMTEIVKASKFKKIDKEVDEELKKSIEQIETYYNITIEEYAKEMNSDVESVKKQLRVSAEEYVKQTIALLAIAEKENIKLSDKQFNSRVQKALDENKAMGYELTKKEMFSQLGGEEKAREYFLQREVMDWLSDKANVVEKDDSKEKEDDAKATKKASEDKKDSKKKK